MSCNGQKENAEILQDEVAGLKDILRLAQVVASTLNFDEVLEKILQSAMELMQTPAGSIALYDGYEAQMTLRAHRGLSERFIAKNHWRVKARGLTGRILAQDEVFVVEDVETTPFFSNPLAHEEGIRALIAVPLKIQDRVVGLLYLDDFQPRTFSPARLRLLPVFGTLAAISIENSRLHEKALHLACTDGLTGLYNHRHFQELMDKEMARAERMRQPLALIILDVDDFKVFNDTYGHLVGDKVLVTVAELLKKTLRESDLVARYGGEEFVALLPDTDLEYALVAAERLRQEIETHATDRVGPHVTRKVTVSMGVAAYPRDGMKRGHLMKIADDLLYGAKAGGKNQIYSKEYTPLSQVDLSFLSSS